MPDQPKPLTAEEIGIARATLVSGNTVWCPYSDKRLLATIDALTRALTLRGELLRSLGRFDKPSHPAIRHSCCYQLDQACRACADEAAVDKALAAVDADPLARMDNAKGGQ